MALTPTQRRYLERAAADPNGEFPEPQEAKLTMASSYLAMRRLLIDAGFVKFDAPRMRWFISDAGRAAVASLPPIKRRPSYRPGGPVRPD